MLKMSHQYQFVTAAGVNVLTDGQQELLGEVSSVGSENNSVQYSLNPGLVGNQQMFSIGPQPGTMIPINTFQPQQLLLVGDGLQQQGLCTVAMSPSNGTIPQGTQFVTQPQVQQLLFEAPTHSNNGFYVNTVPLAGPSWVFSDPKAQTVVPTRGSSLLQNLLEHPQDSLVPVLEEPNGSKQILVMLPSGEQQYIMEVKVPREEPETETTESIIKEEPSESLVKEEPRESKPVIKVEACQPVVKEEPSDYVKNDLLVLKELRPPAMNAKWDPLDPWQPEVEEEPAESTEDKSSTLVSEVKRSKMVCVIDLTEGSYDQYSESQVPRYLEVMAVCAHCGYTSMDFNRCQRCKRKLPPQVKTVPIPKSAPSEPKPTKVPEATKLPEPIPAAKSAKGEQSVGHHRSQPVEKRAPKLIKPETSKLATNRKIAVLQRASLERLEAMAVCSHCGYTSKDLDSCERCKRILPENVKYLLTPMSVPKKINKTKARVRNET